MKRKKKGQQVEEAKMSREVYGVICFKMGGTGSNVYELLIDLLIVDVIRSLIIYVYF